MKKAILFDLDNTLYDEHSAHAAGMEKLSTLGAEKLSIPKEEFTSLYEEAKKKVKIILKGTASSHNRILYMQKLVESFHQTVTPELILELYKTYWDSFIDASKPFDSAIEVLKKLRELEIKTCIVTDLTAFIQLRKTAHLGFTPYIDFIVTSEETGADKPHPSNVLLALDKLEINKHDAIVVGDNLSTDIEAANNLGIRAIHMKFGKHAKNYTGPAVPDFEIEDLSEILDREEILG